MSDTKLIAFYLPQFHPIPENDLWWGKGFTEWSNVGKATPLFPGHYQPHLPGELGYYDLRVPEVRQQQTELAQRYGIYGFCYYYYWFAGRRLLERPLNDMLASGPPDFPFCICWANENWTRRWDGNDEEILMKQEHSPELDERFLHDALPILKDRRYIRIDDAPLLLVYRPLLVPNPKETTAIWRRVAAEAGLPKIHLCAVQSFGLEDPTPLGYDSACQFPPHGFSAPDITDTVEGLHPNFAGKIFDYRSVVTDALGKPSPAYTCFPGVMTGWDNTARRGLRGNLYTHSSPREYEAWLRGAIVRSEATQPPQQRFVFINAWNEWAEGTHLEPDQKHGYGYLEATASALNGRTDWREVIRVVQEQPEIPAPILRGYVRDLEFALEAQERSLKYYQSVGRIVDRINQEAKLAVFSSRVPAALERGVELTGEMYIDYVHGGMPPPTVILDRKERTTMFGWAFAPTVPIVPETQSYLMLRSRGNGGHSYFAPVPHRVLRQDVAAHYDKFGPQFTANSGFEALLWCEAVPSGDYDLGVVHVLDGQAVGGVWKDPVVLR